MLCNKLGLNQSIKGRINIAGAKINDICGCYDIDDNIYKDLNVVNYFFLNTKQTLDVFDDLILNQDMYDIYLTFMTEYSTQYKKAIDSYLSS